MKVYEVVVEGEKYRILSGGIAEATKKAIVAYLGGAKEPSALSVRAEARETPAVEKVG